MSALPPKADMCSATRHVRFVPIADICEVRKTERPPCGGLSEFVRPFRRCKTHVRDAERGGQETSPARHLASNIHCDASCKRGVILEMRVAQLLPAPRVPPHCPNGAALYWAYVQVCAMYSDATQIESPSATAAP